LHSNSQKIRLNFCQAQACQAGASILFTPC
jgi:hypothetical protein